MKKRSSPAYTSHPLSHLSGTASLCFCVCVCVHAIILDRSLKHFSSAADPDWWMGSFSDRPRVVTDDRCSPIMFIGLKPSARDDTHLFLDEKGPWDHPHTHTPDTSQTGLQGPSIQQTPGGRNATHRDFNLPNMTHTRTHTLPWHKCLSNSVPEINR